MKQIDVALYNVVQLIAKSVNSSLKSIAGKDLLQNPDSDVNDYIFEIYLIFAEAA